jgi:glyoxylate/hydroxypyruvate reductase A
MASLTVVIGSFLEVDLVARIAAAQPSATVVYEPELLPVPRYPCDHTGPRRDLPGSELDRWRKLTAAADVFFDFDWLEPAAMPQNAVNLRWIQATSAGIGGFMQRTGLDGSGLAVTTAAGIHAVPLAEFALTGALHFIKGVPELRRRQQARHWQRYTTRQLAGQRVLVAGPSPHSASTSGVLAATTGITRFLL